MAVVDYDTAKPKELLGRIYYTNDMLTVFTQF